MQLLKPLAALLLTFTLNVTSMKAQSSKNVALTNFNEVSVSSGIDVYLTQSNSENIRISANEEVLKNVLIEKSGTGLVIRYKNNNGLNRLLKGQATKVYINYKKMEVINASGGSDVFTENTLKSPRLTVHASGGADVKLDLAVKDLQLSISGGADAKLKGTATNMAVNSSGGSDVHAFELITDYAKVSSSGGSDANVYVNKALEASASGGSDITYKGEAALNKTSSSKSGDVHKAN